MRNLRKVKGNALKKLLVLNKSVPADNFGTALMRRAGIEATRKAHKRAMAKTGFVIKAEGGWIVKQYQDGSVIKIRQLEISNQSGLPALE